MNLEPWVKNILSAIVIVLVGFVLFNLAFLLASGILTLTATITGASDSAPPSVLGFMIFLFVLWLASWFIFRSKINDLAKATFLTMPLMSTLLVLWVVTFDLSHWVALIIGGALCVAIVAFVISKRLSWHYLFATLYVLVLIALIMILDVQI